MIGVSRSCKLSAQTSDGRSHRGIVARKRPGSSGAFRWRRRGRLAIRNSLWCQYAQHLAFCHILSYSVREPSPAKKTKSECAAAFKLPCGKGGSSGSVRPKGPILRKLTGGKFPLQLCPRVMFGHRYLGLQRPRRHS